MESHIIPSFFFKYLKGSSGTGHLRLQQTPNKRIQDGFKEYWLCQSCEDLFNDWETLFANNIFHPLTKKNIFEFTYSHFLLKFCASISWRVLTFLKEKEGLMHLSEELQEESEKCLDHLRLFLLGEEENPGKYQQHIMLLDLIEDHSIPNMPPNINRYFLRNIDIELPYSQTECLVYTKLPYMVIFGFVFNSNKKNWNNTKINLRRGAIGGKDITIPGNLFEFMLERADKSRESENEISEKQKMKIHKDWNNNKDKILKSDTYKALNGDIRLFGDRAYE